MITIRRSLHHLMAATVVICLIVPQAHSASAPVSYPASYTSDDAAMVEAMNNHLDELITPPTGNLSQMATAWLNALGTDWGHPGANFDYQEELIEAIHWLAVHAGSEGIEQYQVAATIRDGLLDFYQSLPALSLGSSNSDISAVYYIGLGAAMKAAALAATPNPQVLPRDVHHAVVEIVSNHAAWHPLYGSSDLTAFLTDPRDEELYGNYVTSLLEELGGGSSTPCPCSTILAYNSNNEPQVTATLEFEIQQDPVRITIWDADIGDGIVVAGLGAYRLCVRLCQRLCSTIANPRQRAICRHGCRGACLPALYPKIP